MIKKSVLLASVVLMTLGVMGSVSADGKLVSGPAEQSGKPAVQSTSEKATTETETVVEEPKQEVKTVDQTGVAKSEFSDAYNTQINQWKQRMSDLSVSISDVKMSDDMNLELFVIKYAIDVRKLYNEILAYTAKNGTSTEADALLQAIDDYEKEATPAFDDLINSMGHKQNVGATPEQLHAKIDAALKKYFGDGVVMTPKPEEILLETKVEPTTKQNDAGTLPETGSDDKSYLSVMGAALAGLTVCGFGFKNRG